MRILIITRDFYPQAGGVANFIHNLADQMGKRGHKVCVLAPRMKGWEKISPQHYRICWCPAWRRLSSLPFIYHTLRLFAAGRVEKILSGHFMSTHALGELILRWLFGIPYAILTHGNDLNYSIRMEADEIVARRLLKNASLVLCNSRFTAEKLREKDYAGDVEILYPGVDTGVFRPGVDTSEIRRKYHLRGQRVIFTVARLVEKKNIDGVLRALPMILGKVPNVVYLIAGEGDKKEELEELVDKLSLKGRVHFLGRIENNLLPQYYCACDLYVMPSKHVMPSQDIETFGISYIEANACEKPVIGGRSGGVTEAVVDGETGLLVDPYNTDEIAGAIVRILTDRELARRLGENGRQRTENELRWEKAGEKLEINLNAAV